MATSSAKTLPHKRKAVMKSSRGRPHARPASHAARGRNAHASSASALSAGIRDVPLHFRITHHQTRQPIAPKPMIATYTEREIRDRIIGGSTHTFVRGVPPLPGSEDHLAPLVDPSIAGLRWDENICRIMVHVDAHLNAPSELWTRSFDVLYTNQNRHIPMFEQREDEDVWVYKGRWEIVRWEICKGGSEEVKKFIVGRKESRKDKTPEAWARAFGEAWARVEVQLARDQSLGNPMETWVQQHAFSTAPLRDRPQHGIAI